MGILLAVLAVAFFLVAQYWGLFVSPPDQLMGMVQKLMYVHVPAAWNAFIAFFIVFVSSVLFVIRKKMFWDRLAGSAAEVGTVLTGLTLMLGSIWGRPTWGVWWTWDARLTTTAILFFLYVGYLTLRSFIGDRMQRARLAAPLGILIFLNVPIVYFSVRWWRTLHQVQSNPSTVDPNMVISLRLNALAILFLLILFIYRRYQITQFRDAAEDALSTPPSLTHKVRDL